MVFILCFGYPTFQFNYVKFEISSIFRAMTAFSKIETLVPYKVSTLTWKNCEITPCTDSDSAILASRFFDSQVAYQTQTTCHIGHFGVLVLNINFWRMCSKIRYRHLHRWKDCHEMNSWGF